MQTILFNLANSGLDQFEFAGFVWPRYVARLPVGSFAQRIAKRKPVVCGEYYHAPKPVRGAHPGKGFYFESDGMPGLRYELSDDSYSAGWGCDRFQGIVFRLPKGRGFLAGWTLGKGMTSEIDGHIWDDERDAMRDADMQAESMAEEAQRQDEEEEDD